METNCVPLRADIFLYSYENEFVWPQETCQSGSIVGTSSIV